MKPPVWLGPPSSSSNSAIPPIENISVRYVKCLSLWTLALIAICIVSGRWQPHLVSDSASYLEYRFSPVDVMVRSMRSPVYPAGLRAAEAITSSGTAALQLVVFAQILLQGFAVSLLFVELLKWGLAFWPALAATGVIAIGCPFWDNISTISTDAAAMSIGVLAAVCILRGWRTGFSLRLSLGLGMCVLLAISLRPAYLYLLPWTACMLLCRGGGQSASWQRRFRDTLLAVSVPAFVLFGWCLFRFSIAGDFSLLPFGHQNMAAVTTQLLDNEELQRLPVDTGELAREIARRRVAVSTGVNVPVMEHVRLSADGLDLRVTSNPALRADSYMTLENRWDAMTYLVVIPAAASVAGDDIIAQHRLLAQLDWQLVRSYPTRYARWWLLAIRRGVWGSVANMVMHPIFLAAIMTVASATILFCVWPRLFSSVARSTRAAEHLQRNAAAGRAVTLIAISYAASGLAFVALTSPTIGRFSDAAFVFVPGLVVILTVQLFAAIAWTVDQSSAHAE